jgi:hypothetical protein
MECPNCGTKNYLQTDKCWKCGTPMELPAAVPAEGARTQLEATDTVVPEPTVEDLLSTEAWEGLPAAAVAEEESAIEAAFAAPPFPEHWEDREPGGTRPSAVERWRAPVEGVPAGPRAGGSHALHVCTRCGAIQERQGPRCSQCGADLPPDAPELPGLRKHLDLAGELRDLGVEAVKEPYRPPPIVGGSKEVRSRLILVIIACFLFLVVCPGLTNWLFSLTPPLREVAYPPVRVLVSCLSLLAGLGLVGSLLALLAMGAQPSTGERSGSDGRRK